jgi:hypothetical protein
MFVGTCQDNELPVVNTKLVQPDEHPTKRTIIFNQQFFCGFITELDGEVNDKVDNEYASINEVDDVTSSELIFEEIDALFDEKFATYEQGFSGKNQEFEKKLTQESPEILSWLTWRLKDVRVLPPTQEVHHASTASD